MSRILVISPHPDDEAIGCGGALLAHVAQQDSVRVVFLTSGEKGGHGRSAEETARVREQEAAQAARILGVEQFEFWRQPDGALIASEPLVGRLRELLAAWQPDWLYAPHADEMHADHKAAHQLVLVTLTRTPQLPRVPQVRLYEIWTPLQQLDEIVDTSPYMETKLAAVRAYQSQCDELRFDEAVQGLNRYRGEMHSWPGGDYAEVFGHLRV